MAVYRNISLSFWTDSKVEDNFSPEDKYMYLYLLTNPHTNIIGCYEISIKQMSRQTGYREEIVDVIINRLEREHNVIRYCKDTKEMLIINWGRYNWTTSDKLTKPITSAINAIKCEQFKAYVGLLFDHIEEIHTVSLPYPYGSDTTVSVSVTDTVSDPNKDKRIVKERGTEYKDKFNTFWSSYPNKQKKAKAHEILLKLKPDDELMNEIMSKLEQFKRSAQWTDKGGQYIPLPTTWLNERRWEDEIPESYSGGEENIKWAQ